MPSKQNFVNKNFKNYCIITVICYNLIKKGDKRNKKRANLKNAQKKKQPTIKEKGETKMQPIFEIVKIKQVIQEVHELDKYKIYSPKDASYIATQMIGDDDREVFLVMVLNTKNQVVAVHRAHVGSLNSSIVTPREVFKAAILNNAASIIVSHQHPSGDPTPSNEDIEVTKRLMDAGRILGIDVLDHLIVTPTGKYYSLKEKGHM